MAKLHTHDQMMRISELIRKVQELDGWGIEFGKKFGVYRINIKVPSTLNTMHSKHVHAVHACTGRDMEESLTLAELTFDTFKRN